MENKWGKIDYTLLHKRRILDKLESLRGRKLSYKELNTAVNQILKMGDQVFPVCINKIKEQDRELLPVVCQVLGHTKDPDNIKNIYNTLMDKRVADDIKTKLLEVLVEIGIDIGELPLEEMIGDFEKMASESMEKMLEDVEEDEFFISHILEDIDTLSKDLQLTCIKDLGETRDERAVPILKALARNNDMEIALEAIYQLDKIKSPKTIDALKEIKDTIIIPDLSSEVDRRIRKLKMQGIMEINNTRTQPKVYKGIVSSLDGLGSRSIWFVWNHPGLKNKLCSLNILINVEEGVKDCWALPVLNKEDFKTAFNELNKETEVLEDFQYAIVLLKDALQTNIVSNTKLPLSMGFWLSFFEKDQIFPEKYKPFHSLRERISIQNEHDLWETSDTLFDTKEFSDWFIVEPKVYEFAEEYLKLKKLYGHSRYFKRRLNKLFENFAREIIKPKEANILRMLELSWDFLVKKSNTKKARQVIAVISNFSKPCYKNPFLKRMIMESLKVALRNIKKGHDLRLDPKNSG